MLDRYTRQAQTLADLRYEPFPDVTSAIPELAPTEPVLCADCAERSARTNGQLAATRAGGGKNREAASGEAANGSTADGQRREAHARENVGSPQSGEPLSTSLSTTSRAVAEGSVAPIPYAQKDAEYGTSQQADQLEVLAGKTVGVQVPSFARKFLEVRGAGR